MNSSTKNKEFDTEQLKNCVSGLSNIFSYPDVCVPSTNCLDNFTPSSAKFPESITLIDLQTEYTRLFINDLPEVTCPPFGSVYLEGTCMGTTTVEVSLLYQSFGWSSKEIADYIAVELEFLAILLSLNSTELDIVNSIKEIVAHLNLWTPEFFKRVIDNDKCGFYRTSAQIGILVMKELSEIYNTNKN